MLYKGKKDSSFGLKIFFQPPSSPVCYECNRCVVYRVVTTTTGGSQLTVAAGAAVVFGYMYATQDCLLLTHVTNFAALLDATAAAAIIRVT